MPLNDVIYIKFKLHTSILKKNYIFFALLATVTGNKLPIISCAVKCAYIDNADLFKNKYTYASYSNR